MNRSIVAAILALFFMIETDSAHAFGRPRPRPTPTPTPTATPTDTPYAYTADELEGIRLINQHRASLGLGAVTKVDFTSNQCLGHNKYMIQQGKPSHDYFADRSMAIQKRFNVRGVAEIVAAGFNTPAGVVAAWLNSPSHKAAIEIPNHKRIGYSLRADPSGKKYYTAIFSE